MDPSRPMAARSPSARAEDLPASPVFDFVNPFRGDGVVGYVGGFSRDFWDSLIGQRRVFG